MGDAESTCSRVAGELARGAEEQARRVLETVRGVEERVDTRLTDHARVVTSLMTSHEERVDTRPTYHARVVTLLMTSHEERVDTRLTYHARPPVSFFEREKNKSAHASLHFILQSLAHKFERFRARKRDFVVL